MPAFAFDKPFTLLVLFLFFGLPLILIVLVIRILIGSKNKSKNGPVNPWVAPGQPPHTHSAVVGTTPPPAFAMPKPLNYQEYTNAFNQAVQLAQAGRKSEAYNQFKGLEWSYSHDVNLLLWLAFTTPNPTEARQAIEAATKLAPTNPSVIQAQQWLKAGSPSF